MAPVSDMAAALRENLVEGYTVEERRSPDGRRRVFYSHPALTAGESSVLDTSDTRGIDDLGRSWADSYSKRFAATLVQNVSLARLHDSALAQVAEVTPNRMVSIPNARPTVNGVAFNLNLPTLNDVAAKEILRIRTHEEADFVAFRTALKSAIRVRVDSGQNDSEAAIAAEIIDDILIPAIGDLDRKVGRAGELLGKRSSVSVAIGGVLTTVGLLAFAPIAVPGIVLGVGGVLASANEYFKDRREIQLSDMHFLWRVSNLRGRH